MLFGRRHERRENCDEELCSAEHTSGEDLNPPARAQVTARVPEYCIISSDSKSKHRGRELLYSRNTALSCSVNSKKFSAVFFFSKILCLK